MTEAEASDIVHQADTESAALRDNADIAGKTAWLSQFLQIGRTGVMRTEDTHAVGPAERDAGIVTDPFDLGLQLAPVLATLSKSAVVNYGTLHSMLCRHRERL